MFINLILAISAVESVKYVNVVSFGDSYSDTSAAGKAYATAWTHYFALSLGAKLTNYAASGAPSSWTNVPKEEQKLTIPDFTKQVAAYKNPVAGKTLYTVFFGINDVLKNLVQGKVPNCPNIKTSIETNIQKILSKTIGANILLLNIPPFQSFPIEKNFKVLENGAIAKCNLELKKIQGVKFIDLHYFFGISKLTAANLSDKSLHPNTAFHQKIAAFVKTAAKL